MSVPLLPRGTQRHRRQLGLAVATVASLALSACSLATGTPTAASVRGGSHAQTSTGTSAAAAVFSTNISKGARAVHVDRPFRLTVAHGTLTDVRVATRHGKVLNGTMSAGKTSYRTTTPFEPGHHYVVTGRAVDAAGKAKAFSTRFHTQRLRLSQQTYPSFATGPGQVVGVAMPVVVHFDVAVTDRANIQKHLKVVTSPAQKGAWHWISANEVHWRPQHFWKPGTKVTVDANVDSVNAGHGIYGQLDRSTTFHVGRAQTDHVNMTTDQLRVVRNGKLIRRIPVTTGAQPQYATRSGIKVIVQKYRSIDMNSATIGIDPNSPQGYNLPAVLFDMRLTYSGEFLHAAPWSVYAQGHENVSHGCTGMSTANAKWLFDHSLIGDPVIFKGSNRPMTLSNGYGDWNLPFSQYREGHTST